MRTRFIVWSCIALLLAGFAVWSTLMLRTTERAPAPMAQTATFAPAPVATVAPKPTETPEAVVEPPAPSPAPITARPTIAPPAATPPVTVDDQLVDSATIAFNTPEQMNVNDQRVLQLLLDVTKAAADLAARITEPGSVQTAQIKISATVEAHLTGTAFTITPITPEEQAITATESTEWKWQVTAREAGRQRLFLTVNAIVNSSSGSQKHSIRTFERTIDVRVVKTDSTAWIIAVVAALVLALIVAIRVRRPTTADATALMPTPSPSPVRSGTFKPGELVAGRYRIVRFVGKGGMGAVYAAEDLEFGGELVAVKTIIPTAEGEERALARFKREIQLARRVAHPNVCKVFDVGYHASGNERAIFVTMQYIDGKPLTQIIREKQRLTERDALPIIHDISAGLGATHAAGLIHRDVKSGNVMVTKDGRAVLMDFGLAAVASTEITQPSLTLTDAIVGSPMYMSPEQLENETLTPASDIYALGIIIYEMVTGQLPYQGDTPMSVIAKRLKEPPIPPTRFAPELDPQWVETILTCLQRDPAKRFQNAPAVAEALRSDSAATQVM